MVTLPKPRPAAMQASFADAIDAPRERRLLDAWQDAEDDIHDMTDVPADQLEQILLSRAYKSAVQQCSAAGDGLAELWGLPRHGRDFYAMLKRKLGG